MTDSIRPIRRLLVANRGEIAVRVFKTARELGITCLAVFSDADADAAHVRAADAAVRLPGETSADTYLNIESVIDASRRAGADAVHPGYGFLAENPAFARAVIDAGLTWVGPAPDSISAMAMKVEAKRLAEQAGVPLVPGAELGEDLFPAPGRVDEARLLELGASIGYPLMVKASAGGGGKGMRVVQTAEALVDAVAAARRESISAFDSGALFLERYLPGARHVEVQVFGDGHGHHLHLGERECSIQRRHQKVIEESPSPGTTPSTREAMWRAAVSLATRIDYEGAGTVEFLVDGSGPDQAFYFLEMNTRLQVEHRVTEMVTGLDLVRWQLDVAAGGSLPVSQEEIRSTGHAIEARLYAEDPANDFLPGAGTLAALSFPEGPGHGDGRDLIVDSGFAAGDVVSRHYDPLIAKVLVHGADRAEAITGMKRVLDDTVVSGLATNKDFLSDVLATSAFAAGDTTTRFIDDHPDLIRAADEVDPLLAVAAALGRWAWLDAGSATVGRGDVPMRWRNVRGAAGFVGLVGVGDAMDGADPRWVLLQRTGASNWSAEQSVGAEPYATQPEPVADVSVSWVEPFQELAGHGGSITEAPVRAVLLLESDGLSTRYVLTITGSTVQVRTHDARATFAYRGRDLGGDAAAGAGGPVAPVPGTVVSVLVEPGQTVSTGDPLVLLEAMKMEHRIVAATDGVVGEVLVRPGQAVEAHAVLVKLDGTGTGTGSGTDSRPNPVGQE